MWKNKTKPQTNKNQTKTPFITSNQKRKWDGTLFKHKYPCGFPPIAGFYLNYEGVCSNLKHKRA